MGAVASSLRLIACLFSFYGSEYLENCGEHVEFDYHHLPYQKSYFSFSLFVEYKVKIALGVISLNFFQDLLLISTLM